MMVDLSPLAMVLELLRRQERWESLAMLRVPQEYVVLRRRMHKHHCFLRSAGGRRLPSRWLGRSAVMFWLSASGRNILVMMAFTGALAGMMDGSATPSGSNQGNVVASQCPITQANNVAPPPHLAHYVSDGGSSSF